MQKNAAEEPNFKTYICSMCGNQWKSKKKNGIPQRCPKCKSRMWNNSYPHICIKCGYEWVSVFRFPDRCPSCQTKKWKEDTEPSVSSSLPDDVKTLILKHYDAGDGCVKISIDLGITFSEVYDAVLEVHQDALIRL